MNRQHGSHGQIKLDPTGTGTAALVASMNAWNLSMTRDRADVTAFGDTNKIYVQGLPDYKGTLGGWFDTDDTTIFDAAMGSIPVGLELIPTDLMPTIVWKGPAYLDASIDVKATGAIAISGNFSAAGNWTFTDTFGVHGGTPPTTATTAPAAKAA